MPARTSTPANSIIRSRLSDAATIRVLALVCSCLAGGGAAVGHEALPTAAEPDGWSYPTACCSGYDCRMVPQTAISERPDGYVIGPTGEVVGYRDARLKYSPDGEYHWCSVAGADNGRTICLFVPPRSY